MERYSESLAIAGLSSGYRDRRIIDGLNLSPIEPGTVVSLIGPNAAGKTTLLRALAGLHAADGSVTLGDRELMGMALESRARLVTYMPQSLPQRVALTVLEAVIGAERASAVDRTEADRHAIVDRAMDVIDRVGIGHLAMSGLDHLSGGQRQLASLAQALVRTPRVLLLDEPISALDLHYQLKVMKLVHALSRERGMIVIMVLHDLAIAARWSDRIVVLSNGIVAADGTPSVAITPAVLADVYRVTARVTPQETGLHIEIDDTL
ncbi:MAG TPA: ABC transporter ATP-binding protein [Croceibacterium sp.]|nr:ABC transporter ATP-binding protein [Croceibacterium sp.]